MTKPNTIETQLAPQPIGPYSQATQIDNLIFTSGQIAINANSGQLMLDTLEDEVSCVLDNLQAVLEAAGSDLSHVIKTTIYLTNLNDFDQVNAVYGRYFSEHKPARACIEVSRLPKNVRVEIDAIAAKPS